MEENLCNSVLFMKSGLLDVSSYGRRNALVLSITGGSIQICIVVDGIITNRKICNPPSDHVASSLKVVGWEEKFFK